MAQRDKKSAKKGGKRPRYLKTVKKTLGIALGHSEFESKFKNG
jgi:hypothetical protein